MRVKELELKKLILELELIEIDEEYIKEFIDNYKKLFNDHLKTISPEFHEKINTPSQPDTNEKLENSYDEEEVIQVDEEEIKKIKKIYKEISKICHPDKISDEELNELYIQAKILYEKNNLLGLIKICKKISLDFEIDQNDITILKRTLKDRKSKLTKIEGTFLWLWVNTETEDEKEKIIKMYIQQYS